MDAKNCTHELWQHDEIEINNIFAHKGAIDTSRSN